MPGFMTTQTWTNTFPRGVVLLPEELGPKAVGRLQRPKALGQGLGPKIPRPNCFRACRLCCRGPLLEPTKLHKNNPWIGCGLGTGPCRLGPRGQFSSQGEIGGGEWHPSHAQAMVWSRVDSGDWECQKPSREKAHNWVQERVPSRSNIAGENSHGWSS